jgi:ribosome-associated protein
MTGKIKVTDMDTLETVRLSADLLWSRQGYDISILNVADLVGYTNYCLILTAKNEKHAQALISHLERRLRSLGIRALGREGVKVGKWALVDFGDFVVHVFHPEERAMYDLESLWSEAPKVEWNPPKNILQTSIHND